MTRARPAALPRTREQLLADLPRPWPRRDIVVPRGTLSVREAPALEGADVEPALFVHGLGGSATNWTDLMALLRDRVDGVAADLPGFGWSPPPRDGDYSPAANAEGLAQLVQARFDGVPVHLFGNSMGGAVAVQLAARHPELVRSLTLVSPALPQRSVARTNVHLPVIAVPGVGSRLMRRYVSLDPGRRAQATVDLCFADPSAVPEQRMAEAVEEVRRRDTLPYVEDAFLRTLRGLLATYLDAGPQRPWRLAERITVPTLLVYGRQDKLVDPSAALRATKAFPDARVVVATSCGHVAQIEDPVLVDMAWRDLIAGSVTRG